MQNKETTRMDLEPWATGQRGNGTTTWDSGTTDNVDIQKLCEAQVVIRRHFRARVALMWSEWGWQLCCLFIYLNVAALSLAISRSLSLLFSLFYLPYATRLPQFTLCAVACGQSSCCGCCFAVLSLHHGHN